MEEMKIGHNIRKIRELRNFTQEYVAGQLDMSVAGYSKIERDEVSINVSKLAKIADILHVEISQIFDFNDKNIFNNYGSANDQSFSQIHNYAHDLVKQYEDEIKHLKEEIGFLRGLVNPQK